MTKDECITLLLIRIKGINGPPPYYLLSREPIDISNYPDIVENQVSEYMPKNQFVIQELKYKKQSKLTHKNLKIRINDTRRNKS